MEKVYTDSICILERLIQNYNLLLQHIYRRYKKFLLPLGYVYIEVTNRDNLDFSEYFTVFVYDSSSQW